MAFQNQVLDSFVVTSVTLKLLTTGRIFKIRFLQEVLLFQTVSQSFGLGTRGISSKNWADGSKSSQK